MPDSDDGETQRHPRRPSVRAVGFGLLLIGAVVVLIAVAVVRWGDDSGPGRPRRSTSVSDTSSPSGRRPPPGGFGEVAVVVVGPDGEKRVLCVLKAETAEQRARGLMEIRDETLGGYDGMIFLFQVDNTTGFWMRNTPMPLSIAYLSGEGKVVSSADMEPCDDSDSCPSYPADGPYRMALEVPQGRLDDVGVVPGSTVELAGACAGEP